MSESFREFVEDQIARVTRVRTRRMFGGVGVYGDDLFFALMDDDILYFKVDDSNRPAFAERGMEPFRPFGDDRSMSYYQVPGDILEDPDALEEWVLAALDVARRAGGG